MVKILIYTLKYARRYTKCGSFQPKMMKITLIQCLGRGVPGPRIRCGAWLQEICSAWSLGKRVFLDEIKIATKMRKLHYFGNFLEFVMLFHSLVLKLQTCGHSVMLTKVWNSLVHKRKRIAQPGTSQIKSELCSRSLPQPSWTGWLWKHAFAGSERVSRLLGPVKSSKSCLFGQRQGCQQYR